MDQITLANVYPLTQRQKVLLLEAGYVPGARELTERWNSVLRGLLSETMFAAAWENVCARHLAFRTAGDTYQVVCSYSSLLFDRCSIKLLFKEALRSYAEIGAGEMVVLDRYAH